VLSLGALATSNNPITAKPTQLWLITNRMLVESVNSFRRPIVAASSAQQIRRRYRT
jgi:hypothetical protein